MAEPSVESRVESRVQSPVQSPAQAIAKAMAQAVRQRAQGDLVHLRCVDCGEEAWAATAALAAGFGWSKLKRIKAGEYRGLCISCRGHPGPP